MRLFARYATVGVANTALHWAVFGALALAGAPQAIANVLGFAAAVTFSFLANARFTFRARATSGRFGLYVVFMGAMAALSGWGADRIGLHPLATLAGFSLFSLCAGFVFSRFVVFGTRP